MNANIQKHIYTQKTVQLGTRVQTAKAVTRQVGRSVGSQSVCINKTPISSTGWANSHDVQTVGGTVKWFRLTEQST